jgi:hypothetical protein
MKKLSRYLILFILAILSISVIVTTTIVYTAHAATNVPAKTTVANVALTTKTVQLLTNQAINQGQTFDSSFTSTIGYKRAAIYVSEVNGINMSAWGQFSPDGVNGYAIPGLTSTLNDIYFGSKGPGNTIYEMGSGNVDGPMFRVEIYNGVDSSYPPSETVSVTLYLMP